jgi:ADP-dependent NAD(P)H-hydrate dehydratase
MYPLHRVDTDRAPIHVDDSVLARHPLPGTDDVASKRDRGHVLIIGGSAETPGGVLLAGIAALRAGAGRVQIATVASVARALAIQLPEARVTALPETRTGAISPDGASELRRTVEESDVVLVGTGAIEASPTAELLEAVVPTVPSDTALIVDAGALHGYRGLSPRGRGAHLRVTLLPNPGEMCALLDEPFERVEHDPVWALRTAVDRFTATIALRDEVTWIAEPGGDIHRDTSGDPALATSGSGDVLAGCVAGLAARGAAPVTALLRAVHAHGSAGSRLARRDSGPGLLARELVDLLPVELNAT